MLDPYFPYSVFAFFLTFFLTAVTERRLIPALRKKARQPIYEGGPKWHLTKSGTPTMGGIAFPIALTVLGALFLPFLLKTDREEGLSFLFAVLYAVLNAAVGLLDDLTKLKRRENAGLSPMEKLVLQTAIAAGFLVCRGVFLHDSTALRFVSGSVDLSLFYYPIALLVLVGTVNCANLTDGIDGLASSVAFAIGVSFFYLSSSIDTGASLLSSALVGISLGFLVFNLHPAKIFMGDTGSLFFGALAAALAFSLGNPLIALPAGIVYVVEGASVILQVGFFKLTKKRLFRMAPLHHHFEKCGWSENRICMVAIFLTLLFAIPAYLVFLPG